MDFLRVYPKGTTLEQMRLSNGLCILKEAKGVNITDEINSTSTLTFSLPQNSDKWQYLSQGNLILYEGRIFSIYLKERQKEQTIYRTVTAYSLISEASEKLILIFPVMVAVTPKEVMTEAFKDTNFEILDILPNGMEWVTTKTDFVEAQSKLTPLDVAEQLIDKIGEGEIYCDNYKIALVKKVISNTAVINATPKFNLKAVSDSEDGTGIITRLYPFGKDDMTLAGDTPYVDSPLQSVYGLREGYIDYKDITSQEELKEKAEWEFSEDNPQRIDMPSLFYTLSLADVWKIYGEKYKVGLGDTVKITDIALELETFQRIIKINFYPYSPENSTVTLGTPPKTIKSVIQSLAKTEEKYNKTLDENGNIKTEWLSNLIRNQSEYITDLLLANEVVKHKIGDLWTFENPAGDKAIAIVDGQLAISDKKNDDGTWNWTTFINGKSVSASVLNSGELNTSLIEIKSQSGNTSLSGDSFKMVAEDGTTVSIRSTDSADGLKKGMQIIENFDEDGNPLNYSIYDSAGYRRYINGVRVQTYSVMWSGTQYRSSACDIAGGSYTSGSIYSSHLHCVGNYYYNWAVKYNDSTTTDTQRKQMLQHIVSDNTVVPNTYFGDAYKIGNKNYGVTLSTVTPVKPGDIISFKYRGTVTDKYTVDFTGAVIEYTVWCYYAIYESWVSSAGLYCRYFAPVMNWLLITTMDV